MANSPGASHQANGFSKILFEKTNQVTGMNPTQRVRSHTNQTKCRIPQIHKADAEKRGVTESGVHARPVISVRRVCTISPMGSKRRAVPG